MQPSMENFFKQEQDERKEVKEKLCPECKGRKEVEITCPFCEGRGKVVESCPTCSKIGRV